MKTVTFTYLDKIVGVWTDVLDQTPRENDTVPLAGIIWRCNPAHWANTQELTIEVAPALGYERQAEAWYREHRREQDYFDEAIVDDDDEPEWVRVMCRTCGQQVEGYQGGKVWRSTVDQSIFGIDRHRHIPTTLG